MLTRQRKIEMLERALGKGKSKGRNEILFFCPKHDHPRPKLSVNIETEKWHCWFANCGWRGRDLVPILRLGSKQDLTEYESTREKKRANEEPIKVYDRPVLPPEFKPLLESEASRSPYGRHALAYARCRGITEQDVLFWKIGFCDSGEYSGRIVFPSFDLRGNLNFVIGRDYYGTSTLAYKHGSYDKDIIWNEYAINWNQPVTIIEGLVDAIKVGENAIPLIGVEGFRPGSRLFDTIVERKPKTYLALDCDAQRRQDRIAQELAAYGVPVFVVPLGPRKDVGEMDHEEFVRAATRAVPIRNRMDVLRHRLGAA